MRTLYIDLAGAEKWLALVDEKAVVGMTRVEDSRDEAAFMPKLEAFMRGVGCALQDIARIATVAGPGGFMTLRVQMGIVNALAYGLHVPAAAVHASDVWKHRIQERDWMWLHSTKKTHMFVRGMGAYAARWPQPVLLSVEEAAHLPKQAAWAGELIPEHAALLTGMQLIANPRPVEAVLPDVVEQLSYDKKTLLPWYGRGA